MVAYAASPGRGRVSKRREGWNGSARTVCWINPMHPMQKKLATRIAVKRAEDAWDSPGRIASGAAPSGRSAEGQTPPWPWEPVLEGARRQLNYFISLEPKVLKGDDPDAIHDIRVASRRLQQVLDLIEPSPRAPKVRKIRRAIQRSRRALSVVRNCDVLLERTGRILARKRAARTKSPFRSKVARRA